jgi:hypothetical protein
VVVARERSVGGDHDAVHRADAPRQRVELVDQVERGFLMWNRQVAAGKAERRQRAQRRAQAVGLDRQRQVAAGELVLREPVIVQGRRARMHHRPAHQARKQETIPVRHGRIFPMPGAHGQGAVRVRAA